MPSKHKEPASTTLRMPQRAGTSIHSTRMAKSTKEYSRREGHARRWNIFVSLMPPTKTAESKVRGVCNNATATTARQHTRSRHDQATQGVPRATAQTTVRATGQRRSIARQIVSEETLGGAITRARFSSIRPGYPHPDQRLMYKFVCRTSRGVPIGAKNLLRTTRTTPLRPLGLIPLYLRLGVSVKWAGAGEHKSDVVASGYFAPQVARVNYF